MPLARIQKNAIVTHPLLRPPPCFSVDQVRLLLACQALALPAKNKKEAFEALKKHFGVASEFACDVLRRATADYDAVDKSELERACGSLKVDCAGKRKRELLTLLEGALLASATGGEGGDGAAMELPTAFMPPARVVQLLEAGEWDARVLAAGARALVELTGGEGLCAARGAALAARGVIHEARCAECVGALPMLVRALEGPPAECAVACLALRNIASFDAQIDACAAAGAVPALVGALARHAGEADVCGSASIALQNIITAGDSDEHRDACAEAGAISALVGALTRHAGEAGVCQSASAALGNIAAGSEAHRDACAAAGAIPALVDALTRHAGEVGVCNSASAALWSIAACSVARMDACAAAGAIPALVDALTRHAGVAGVCERASGALQNIALGSDAYRDACATAGAIPALVDALTYHAGEAGVCNSASGALVIIASGSDAHRDACAEAGAIPALVGALTRHAGVAGVCACASGALAWIVWTSPAHRRTAVALGAVRRLAAAWSAHPSAKNNAHIALEKMGYRYNGTVTEGGGGDDGLAAEFPSAEMPPARVVQLMNAGAWDARVAEAGASALRRISLPDGAEDSCVAAGAIPALVDALTRHAGEAGVCESASWALSNIAAGSSEARKDACAAAGAIPALVGALTRHAGEAGVCKATCGALANITLTSDAHRDACAAAGAIPALVGALTRHELEAVVCECASGALANIAKGNSGGRIEDACAAAGAIPALVGALTRHAGMAGVCKAACCALAGIVWTSPAHRRAAVAAGAVPRLSAAWSAHPSAKDNAYFALEKLGYRP